MYLKTINLQFTYLSNGSYLLTEGYKRNQRVHLSESMFTQINENSKLFLKLYIPILLTICHNISMKNLISSLNQLNNTQLISFNKTVISTAYRND